MYLSILTAAIGLVLVYLDNSGLLPRQTSNAHDIATDVLIYGAFAVACAFAAWSGWRHESQRDAQVRAEIDQQIRNAFFDFDEVWVDYDSGKTHHVRTSANPNPTHNNA